MNEWVPPEGFSDQELRSLNDAADIAAEGRSQQRWTQERAPEAQAETAAMIWARRALNIVASAEERYLEMWLPTLQS